MKSLFGWLSSSSSSNGPRDESVPLEKTKKIDNILPSSEGGRIDDEEDTNMAPVMFTQQVGKKFRVTIFPNGKEKRGKVFIVSSILLFLAPFLKQISLMLSY